MRHQPIEDYLTVALPPDVDRDDPGLEDRLQAAVMTLLLQQYEVYPMAILIESVKWCITNDMDEITAFKPDHLCPACLAGHDQAMAFLQEHPNRLLACANVHYIEIWPEDQENES